MQQHQQQTRVVNLPQVETEVTKWLTSFTQLIKLYQQVSYQFLTDEINMPEFHRLFRLIHVAENWRYEELVQFQVIRGQKVDLHDQPIKPIVDVSTIRTAEQLIMKVLETEKHFHQMTVDLVKVATQFHDVGLIAFVERFFFMHQVKVIKKRASQLKYLQRNQPGMGEFVTDNLVIKQEYEGLQAKMFNWIRMDTDKVFTDYGYGYINNTMITTSMNLH